MWKDDLQETLTVSGFKVVDMAFPKSLEIKV